MDIKFNEKNAYLKPLCEVLNVEIHLLLEGSVEGQAPENPSGGGGNFEDGNP